MSPNLIFSSLTVWLCRLYKQENLSQNLFAAALIMGRVIAKSKLAQSYLWFSVIVIRREAANCRWLVVQCTKRCGGGYRQRLVRCINMLTKNTVQDEQCSSQRKPTQQEDCNVEPCQSWKTSSWHQVWCHLVTYLGCRTVVNKARAIALYIDVDQRRLVYPDDGRHIFVAE